MIGLKNSKRELLNAVLYLVDNGCKWFATRISSVADVLQFFCRAKETALLDRILQHLAARRRAGRNPNSTYAIIDSQSIDTAYKSERVGFGGGTKVINGIS